MKHDDGLEMASENTTSSGHNENFFSALSPQSPVLPLAAVAILGALILTTFGMSSHYDFLSFDSVKYILEDRAIRVVDWEHIHHIFTSYYFINYNPLHRISYMMDYALWGTDPAGYRSTNFLLHWMAASFVFLFFYELTARSTVAWMTSLVFAIHPTRVESVVWLAQRKDVLAAAFGFAALWLYVKAKGKRQKAKGKSSEPAVENQESETQNARSEILNSQFSILNSSAVWYAACVLMYLCALASKAQWVPLCAVFVALDLSERRRITQRVVLSYLPFFFLSALFAWYAVDSQLIQGKKGAGAVMTLWDRLANPLIGVGLYTFHAVWPINLCPRYPETTVHNPVLVGLGLVVVLLSAIAAIQSWRRKREIFFGVAWFFLFLMPVLNLLPGSLLPADRYLYVSILGLVFPAAMMVSRLAPLFSVGVLYVLVIPMLTLTLIYEPVWKDGYSLWSYTVELIPDDPFTLTCLGKEQIERKDFAAAKRTFERASALPMWFAPAVTNYSKLAKLTGADPEAILKDGLAQFPNSPDVKAAYGHYWLDQKNYPEAERYFLESKNSKVTVEVLHSLALLYEQTRQPEKGIPNITLALQTDIFNEEFWLVLGRLYEVRGTFAEAETAYRESARLDPTFTEPRYRLAQLAARRGAWNEAQQWLLDLRRALAGKPMSVEALNLLSTVYRSQGKALAANTAAAEAANLTRSRNDPKIEVNVGQSSR